MKAIRASAISCIASIFLLGCSTNYNALQAKNYVHDELQLQFARYFQHPKIGAILVRPALGEKCIDAGFDQCVEFYVRPLNESDPLFHIKPENIKFTLESASPSEPQFSGFRFFYRWSCCEGEMVARGIAAFSPRGEVLLEGQTVSGEELSFSY